MRYSWIILCVIICLLSIYQSVKANIFHNNKDGLIWMKPQINGKFEIIISTDLADNHNVLSSKISLLSGIDIMYLDKYHHKLYAMNATNDTVNIIEYDILQKLTKSLCNAKNRRNISAILYDCNVTKCSLFVDHKWSKMYFTTSYAHYWMDLRTLAFRLLSKNVDNKYSRINHIRVHDNEVYFIMNGTRILKQQLSDVINLNASDHLLQRSVVTETFENYKISSFVIDKTHDVIYFASNDYVYYNHMSLVTKPKLYLNINSSTIHSLEINADGGMLFIQYYIEEEMYLMKLPSLFGCTQCKSISKLLYTLNANTNVSTTITTGIALFYSPWYTSASVRKLLSDSTLTPWSRSWNSSSVPLLGSQSTMGIGYYNNSIFLIGGTNKKQVTEYDITSDIMIDYGTDAIPYDINGNAQFYTQVDEILFMINPSGNTISTYNLKTHQFTYSWNDVTIPISGAGSQGCMTSINNYLFIVGGKLTNNNNKNTFQILNMSTYEWTIGSNMIYTRSSPSCNVHPVTETLYVIGGYSGYMSTLNPRKTIEKIFVGENINIGTQIWEQLNDQLLDFTFHRSVVFEDYIIIIGGYRPSAPKILEIQSINCLTDDVQHFTGFLNYGISGAGVIIAQNTLYAFGGGDSPNTQTWQYCHLGLTAAPTVSPTTCLTFNASVDTSNNDAHYVMLDWKDYYYESLTSDSQIIYRGNEEHKYYIQTIPCSNDLLSVNKCFVNCTVQKACVKATIHPITALNTLSMICSESRSCMDSTLVIDNVNIYNMSLICVSPFSCYNMNININMNHTLWLQTLTIFCINSFACHGMHITFIAQQNAESDDVNYRIICQESNSCKEITLKEIGISITMVLYEYSEGLTIINNVGFTVDSIICGLPSDTKTITYDIDDLAINPQEIYAQALSLYESEKFPCQDIIFRCIASFNDDEICEVSYDFITPTALIPIDYTVDSTCYYINIKDLQNIECDLKCNAQQFVKNETYYVLNVTYDYALVFTHNSSLDTNIHCMQYFGDKQATELSLNQINIIFSTSLSFYTHRDYINSVSEDAKTILLSNDNPHIIDTYSECINDNETASIRLNTFFQVKIKNDTIEQQEINAQLFTEDSFFYNETIELIIRYFDP
eukprot:378388_1